MVGPLVQRRIKMDGTAHMALRNVEDRHDVREAAHVHRRARGTALQAAAELSSGEFRCAYVRGQLLGREVLRRRPLTRSADVRAYVLSAHAAHVAYDAPGPSFRL